jgi:hypothetical protein
LWLKLTWWCVYRIWSWYHHWATFFHFLSCYVPHYFLNPLFCDVINNLCVCNIMNETCDFMLSVASMCDTNMVFVSTRFNSLSYFTLHLACLLCNLCNCRAFNVNRCFFFWKWWIKGARGLSGIMLNSFDFTIHLKYPCHYFLC